MKTTLDHLPEKQQGDLARVRPLLPDELEAAKNQGSDGASDWRKNGQVLQRAYVQARYSDQYDTGQEDPTALKSSAERLAALVKASADRRLAVLAERAG